MIDYSKRSKKTAETNKKLYGEDYYKKIGAIGGKRSKRSSKKIIKIKAWGGNSFETDT